MYSIQYYLSSNKIIDLKIRGAVLKGLGGDDTKLNGHSGKNHGRDLKSTTKKLAEFLK
jgi:hypothetical protein